MQEIFNKFGDKFTEWGYIIKSSIDNITYGDPIKEGFSVASASVRIKVSFTANCYVPSIGQHLIAQVTEITKAEIILYEFPFKLFDIAMLNEKYINNINIGDYVEVKTAIARDGILTVKLERIVPEEHKPKKIAINYNK